jgi:dienelactone hydrolase
MPIDKVLIQESALLFFRRVNLMLNRNKFAFFINLFVALSILLLDIATAQQPTPASSAPIGILGQEIRIPMAAAGAIGLQGFFMRPSSAGKHPLVLMTHGTDYSNGKNREIGPGMLQPEAMWFARRGWAIGIVVRRGYGESGGQMDKRRYGCSQSDFEAIAEEDAADLQAAYEYLSHRPDVDSSELIAVGVSTGGFAVVSFGAKAPKALKAVINFSGGWHSLIFSGSCSKSGIVPAFHQLGSRAHVPMMWIYAKNDQMFGPKYVAQVHEAFTSAGGDAELATVERSGENGHYLFSESPQLWGPIIQSFLARQKLPSEPLIPDPAPPRLKLPLGFSDDAQKAFLKFQTLGPYKAFAIGPGGAWSYSSGKNHQKWLRMRHWIAVEIALVSSSPTIFHRPHGIVLPPAVWSPRPAIRPAMEISSSNASQCWPWLLRHTCSRCSAEPRSGWGNPASGASRAGRWLRSVCKFGLHVVLIETHLQRAGRNTHSTPPQFDFARVRRSEEPQIRAFFEKV